MVSSVSTVIALLAIGAGYYLKLQEDLLWKDHLHNDENQCKTRKLGEEDAYWDAQLNSIMPELMSTLEQFMDQRQQGLLDDPKPDGIFKRVQHPVDWGCLEAEFEVNPNIAANNKVGMFKHVGSKFPTVIRLSKNGFEPDNAPKVSSISMKIMTGDQSNRAKGLKEYSKENEQANKDTNDFVMVSSTYIPLGVVPQDMITVHKWLMWGKLPGAVLFILKYRPTLFPRTIKMLVQGMGISNPFSARHYAVHPYKWGNDMAVKVSLQPCDESGAAATANLDSSNIKKSASGYLKTHETCMKLMIQRQQDPCVDFVDDFLVGTEGWPSYKSDRSKWEHVGTLRVKQNPKMLTDQQCEDLYFNPFHTTEETRPLGWIAKLRQEVYARLSARRIAKNRASRS